MKALFFYESVSIPQRGNEAQSGHTLANYNTAMKALLMNRITRAALAARKPPVKLYFPPREHFP